MLPRFSNNVDVKILERGHVNQTIAVWTFFIVSWLLLATVIAPYMKWVAQRIYAHA